MKRSTSINILLTLLAIVIVFHFLIVIKIIPYSIAWGGRLQSDTAMYAFESASILINLFLVWLLLMKVRYVNAVLKEKTIKIFLWIFFALFLLNTVGNLFAKTAFERTFSIITLVFSILIWKVIKEDPLNHPNSEFVSKCPNQ